MLRKHLTEDPEDEKRANFLAPFRARAPGSALPAIPRALHPPWAQPEPDGDTSWLRRKTRGPSGLGRLTLRGKQAQQTLPS